MQVASQKWSPAIHESIHNKNEFPHILKNICCPLSKQFAFFESQNKRAGDGKQKEKLPGTYCIILQCVALTKCVEKCINFAVVLCDYQIVLGCEFF